MVIFHSFLYVYQRVSWAQLVIKKQKHRTAVLWILEPAGVVGTTPENGFSKPPKLADTEGKRLGLRGCVFRCGNRWNHPMNWGVDV